MRSKVFRVAAVRHALLHLNEGRSSAIQGTIRLDRENDRRIGVGKKLDDASALFGGYVLDFDST
jgi:hypothetical protein